MPHKLNRQAVRAVTVLAGYAACRFGRHDQAQLLEPRGASAEVNPRNPRRVALQSPQQGAQQFVHDPPSIA